MCSVSNWPSRISPRAVRAVSRENASRRRTTDKLIIARLLLMIHPPKRLLYGPGPTMVEPRVYEAMSKPIVGHLDPFFFSVVEDIRAGLREVFGTKNDFTFAISGTGSSGMEAAVANFVEPGQKLAVFANGFFC